MSFWNGKKFEFEELLAPRLSTALEQAENGIAEAEDVSELGMRIITEYEKLLACNTLRKNLRSTQGILNHRQK